ncbi:MAG: hypothetical protein ACFE9X_17580 [Promethearchaeota archaeon]
MSDSDIKYLKRRKIKRIILWSLVGAIFVTLIVAIVLTIMSYEAEPT